MMEAGRTGVVSELLAEALRRRHAIRIRAQGTSMLPAIWPGDVLTVAPGAGSAPQIGEIALTTANGRMLAHRVVGRIGQGGALMIVTRGDALASVDPPVGGGSILGIVVARNGQPVERFTRPQGNLFVSLLARSGVLLRFALALRSFARRLPPGFV